MENAAQSMTIRTLTHYRKNAWLTTRTVCKLTLTTRRPNSTFVHTTFERQKAHLQSDTGTTLNLSHTSEYNWKIKEYKQYFEIIFQS